MLEPHEAFKAKDPYWGSQVLEQAAAMGDDWPDLRLMKRCAFSGAPSNAHVEVRAIADYVSTKQGGEGAVREFCDVLLLASGKYAAMLAEAAS